MKEKCEHCVAKTEEKEVFKVGKRLKITILVFVAVFIISYLPLPYMAELNESLISYIKLIWWAVLLGFIIGGLIYYFIPEEFIYKYLGKKKKSSIIYAVLAGLLMSACSHGILAISMELYRKGASIPAIMTFLLASPWANLPVTILLFGFFGLNALYFIGGAMVIAVVTGFIYSGLETRGWIEKSKDIPFASKYEWTNVKHFNLKKSIRGVTYGAVNLADMVLWWILIGTLMAAVIGAYVPGHIFIDYFGPTIAGLFLTLVVATIIEICSEGSAPIAFEVYAKVGTLGNPFVFLMAGVVTDYTEIGIIWSNIGKRTAIWLPIITVPQVLFMGYLFNIFL